MDSYWENIEQSDEIIQENKGTLRDFARDQKLNDLSLARIYKLITYMGPMAKQLDKPFEKADRDDIKDILEWVQDKGVADSTERDYKVILKKILQMDERWRLSRKSELDKHHEKEEKQQVAGKTAD